jgi:hypothetical protein
LSGFFVDEFTDIRFSFNYLMTFAQTLVQRALSSFEEIEGSQVTTA